MNDILWFAGIIGIVYFGFKILISKKRSSVARSAFRNPESLPQWEETGQFKQEVVGESFYKIQIQKVVEKIGLATTCTAVLELEEDNEHDKNAVAVVIEGFQVGHLPRAAAKKFRNACRQRGIRQFSSCKARLYGGTTAKPEIGVWLDLPKI